MKRAIDNLCAVLPESVFENESHSSSRQNIRSIDVKDIKRIIYDVPKMRRNSKIEFERFAFSLRNDQSKKKTRPKMNKSHFITRKDRIANGLLKLPQTGWDYNTLYNTMHMVWLDYMKEVVGTIGCATDQNLTDLMKCELVGSLVEVVQSTNPTLVGLKGVVVLETKNTFQIITSQSKLKILSKESCVFEFKYFNGKTFRVFGRNLKMRPADRSTMKKLKLRPKFFL